VALLSPEGYEVYRSGNPGFEKRVVVITTDGRLWQSKEVVEKGRARYVADYLPITGQALLNGEIWIGGRVDIKDARPYIPRSEMPDEPLEDSLAVRAAQLLRHPSRR
jgi:hypothetical protein